MPQPAQLHRDLTNSHRTKRGSRENLIVRLSRSQELKLLRIPHGLFLAPTQASLLVSNASQVKRPEIRARPRQRKREREEEECVVIINSQSLPERSPREREP
jgi:hypothetical protein